jgi:hypothetical protein
MWRPLTRGCGGVVQILTEYSSAQLPLVLEALERMHAHLTAAVVSNDALFLQVRAHPASPPPLRGRGHGRMSILKCVPSRLHPQDCVGQRSAASSLVPFQSGPLLSLVVAPRPL